MLKEDIEGFLAEKKMGVVGVSRSKGKFGNLVYKKLKESGCALHPVHPEMESFEEDRCIKAVSQLPDDVRALMIVANPDVCAKVLGDVPGTKIERIWMFSGKKDDPDIESKIQSLKDAGVSVISGFCPFLFLEPVTSVHSIHRFFAMLFGKLPK